MDRRRFLTGLLALPVAAQLGRVYSFPTDIVIPKWPPYTGGGYSPAFNTQSNLPSSAAIYFDYLNYYDVALITAVDPVLEKVAREMGHRAAFLS